MFVVFAAQFKSQFDNLLKISGGGNQYMTEKLCTLLI